MQQILFALVENKPGVLNRVVSLFRRRKFNIESLNVGRTEKPEISRMTIVLDKNAVDARTVEANLYKLVNVIDVQDLTNQPSVVRDLALIKVRVSPEDRSEVVNLAAIFRANIVDVAPESVVVEITGTEDKIESLVELLRPIGIEELVRTGQVAMMRGSSDGTRHTPGANGKQKEQELVMV
ncbi:MAG: acetolactate synthase small subunit [Anaerolineales bacterium]|nr:acetolactate synthase small subunit [Anaerolineales bacterium]